MTHEIERTGINPIEQMQQAVDVVNTSLHQTNKIAATIFGGPPTFSLSRTNYWPDSILKAFCHLYRYWRLQLGKNGFNRTSAQNSRLKIKKGFEGGTALFTPILFLSQIVIPGLTGDPEPQAQWAVIPLNPLYQAPLSTWINKLFPTKYHSFTYRSVNTSIAPHSINFCPVFKTSAVPWQKKIIK